MIARGIAPLLAALLLTACAAPEFKQPAIDTPAAFKEAAAKSKPLPTAAPGNGAAGRSSSRAASGGWPSTTRH
jgi:multidrug efflux system outer membrane protein